MENSIQNNEQRGIDIADITFDDDGLALGLPDEVLEGVAGGLLSEHLDNQCGQNIECK